MSKIQSRALAAALLCAAMTSAPAATPHRAAVPGSAPSVTNRPAGNPSALLADPRFGKTWRATLGAALFREAWLVDMDGPAPEPRWVAVDGSRYVLNAFCKPHDCFDSNAVQLYSPDAPRVYGLVHHTKGDTLVGDPPPAVAAALHRLWLGEWRQHLK